MKDRFYFSRTYEFEAAGAGGRVEMFEVTRRTSREVTFRPVKKGSDQTFKARVKVVGDMETASFDYDGQRVALRADKCHPKGYGLSPDEYVERRTDLSRDLHLHTLYNRDEVERSEKCHCMSCRESFAAAEVTEYCDEGRTAPARVAAWTRWCPIRMHLSR